jgi:hypothetical protein
LIHSFYQTVSHLHSPAPTNRGGVRQVHVLRDGVFPWKQSPHNRAGFWVPRIISYATKDCFTALRSVRNDII